MRSLGLLCVLLLGPCPITSGAHEAAPSVELYWQERLITLPESARQQLRQQAERLVQSSNFHSNPGDKDHVSTQRGYRREIAGSFLLISFTTPQRIKTVGGEISVAEIVVGLNRDDYASNLFTIDDSGRIIGHSKFAGALCIEIFRTVKQFTQ